MILFKNRYAEFDNLDDAYNQNVFRNCYHREYFKNFSKFNRPNNRNENLRYSRGQNFNDIRLNNYNNYQRQSAMTPFPQLPLINNNNGNYGYQQQNFLHQRSSPNMPSAFSNNNNYIRTPISRYNNYDNNEYGFKSNNYDGNISNDDIQFYNEGNNILNISNDSQYSQEQNQNILRNSNEYIRQSLDNELDVLEKERKLLLEQEKLKEIDFQLRYLRQKRKSDLERRLAEEQQNLELINRIKENDLEKLIYNNNQYNNKRRINNNYRINNFRNNNNAFNNNKILEESLKTSVLNDKFYMNGLIDEINRMKLSQQEANLEFQRKMKDLEKQNESIQIANQKMIQKIKDMKNALSSDKKENNDDYYNDNYLIGQRNNRIKEKKLFENNYDNISNSISYISRNKYSNNNYINFKDFDDNNRNYYLGKKDKDIEEFNSLNKNLVNNNNMVVTPLLYNENKNKYNKNFDLYNQNENYQKNNRFNYDEEYKKSINFPIGNDYSDTRKENLYSLIRKNNDRLERIKEIEEKNKYDVNY